MDDTLHGRFLRGLAVAGDRDAFRIGDHRVSYESAHRSALAWAGALLDSVTEPPTAVGVLANKSETAYLGTLAALYTGAAVVPLHPDHPVSRTRQAVRLAGVSAVITDERGAALLDGDDGMPDVSVLVPDRGLPPGGALREPRPVAADDPAYILFTSGSTGRPKGVPISHGATAHYFRVLAARYDFTSRDVFSQTFDLTFDCALFDLFCAWGSGGCVVPVPPSAYRGFPEFIAEQRITVWFSTPSGITLLRKTGALSTAALPSLRWSLFAGEALPAADAEAWLRSAPNSTLENLYGPTELTITCAAHRWSPSTPPDRYLNGVVPIGRVNDGLEHLLLGPDGQVGGDEGELCVTGPQTCGGYLDPADDRGRFLEHDARTWYRTGDRVRRFPDGELAYLGRVDDQVQLQGWRVELPEITHAVRGCAEVDEATTVVAPLDRGDELVVFYTGQPVRAVRLARQLRSVLPQHLIPRHFQHLDELPLNANRKIDRVGLQVRAEEEFGGQRGAPAAASPAATEASDAAEAHQPARPATAPSGGLLHEMLDERAAATPDAPAVRDGRESWTYQRLAARGHAVARWLDGQRVRRGDRVLTQLPNGCELAALLFGCARRGVTLVPLNPGMKDYHLRSVLADAEPALAIVADDAVAGLRELTELPVHGLDTLRAELSELAAVEPAGSAGAAGGEPPTATPSDLGVLIYTSGSTAAPKGVMCPQAQMVFAARAIQGELGYRPNDVVYCRLPLSFDYGLFQVLLCCLAGAELVLAGDGSDLKLLTELRECGATVFPAVPSLAGMLVKLADRDPGPTSLRMFTNTGAALPQEVIDGLREHFPGACAVRMFGTTECKRITIMPPHQELERPTSVGRPLPGTRVTIVDDAGQPLPAGEIGEITVTGPHVMAGYWRAPELTARTFRPVPDSDETRLHTGDFGSVDADGFVYFQGRRDDLFKRKGSRMSATEIEAAAMDVPGVRSAAVLPPTEDRDLTLCVVGDVRPVAVNRELSQRVEAAKVPAHCVVLAEFPLTLNGKIEKKQLAALAEEALSGGAPRSGGDNGMGGSSR